MRKRTKKRSTAGKNVQKIAGKQTFGFALLAMLTPDGGFSPLPTTISLDISPKSEAICLLGVTTVKILCGIIDTAQWGK